MKKRLLAFVLSLTLCIAPVVQAEASAADISSGAQTQEMMTADAFSSGEGQGTVIETQQPTTEAQPTVVPEPTTEAQPTVTPEATTEVQSTVTPEATTEVQPTVTPEATTEVPPTITPEGTVTPDINVDAVDPDGAETTETTETPEITIEDMFSDGEAVDVQDLVIEEESSDAAGTDTSLASDSVDLADGEVLDTYWVKDANGNWKLKMHVEASEEGEAEEKYYTNCLVEITTKDSTGAVINKAAWYMFDSKGIMVTGRKTIKKGFKGYKGTKNSEFFFMNAKNVKKNSSSVKTATPYNSNLGQMQKNYNWLWDGGAFHSYGSDGSAKTIKANQFYKIGNDHYYLLSGGKPFVGEKVLTYQGRNGLYYFQAAKNSNDIPGKMLRNQWVCRKTKYGYQWRFFKADGRQMTHGVGIAKLLPDQDKYYLLNAYGYIIKNRMMKASNGAYYLSDKSGVIYREKLVKVGNYRYYFGADGKLANWKNRWVRCKGADNRVYYFGSVAGRVEEKRGWQGVTNNGKFYGWFYFANNGNHYMNGMVGNYYFLADGRLVSGFRKINGKFYYFDKSTTTVRRGELLKNKWISANGKRYRACSTGALYYGRWVMVERSWYYFQADCSVKTNCAAVRDGVYGWLDSNGKFSNGWIVVNEKNNKVRYLDSKTGQYLKNTSKVIDGFTYYFDANGYRINDLTKTKYFAQYRGSYYVEVDRQNGVMTVYNSARNVPLKTIRVSVGNPITLTRTGTYRLTRAGRWQALMGPSWGQYGSHVTGGIYVHSVACAAANSYNLPAGEYNKLGSPASHGCIRCCVADAKWIWDNCNGSTIRIYDGAYESNEAFKGPLGRNPLTPLYGSMNFDPTDPAV